ncbi:Proliferating cell nuclear antigen [Giardia muris]|uniref:DNA sliding clamp PCNA n=1 Tax=Giardia muris TaxID=5742 RepID=A0A4Z1SNP1_GIAMU|nr:Proliferating cell nuclear antigen [Giardia muris]|eukprot:TNJ27412.1 Proliferating cell nuclear antigen [Giardia muris]
MSAGTLNFELTFHDAVTVKRIFETLVLLAKDVPMMITDNGLVIETIDNGRIALISLNLPATFFRNFRCERSTVLGIRTASFLRVIKFCSNDDLITLSQRTSTTDQLDILVEARAYNQTMSFSLRLYRLDDSQLDIQRPDFESMAIISSGRFTTLVRDLMSIGKTCRIMTNLADSSISFEVMGDDTKGTITLSSTGLSSLKNEDDEQHDLNDLNSDGIGEVEIKIKQPVDKKYPLNYISHFTKAASLSETVMLELSDTSPMRVCYRLKGGNNGYLAFLLAYKMDDDDLDEEQEQDYGGDDDI